MTAGRPCWTLPSGAGTAQRFHLFAKGQRALKATALALEALFPSPGLAMGTERARFDKDFACLIFRIVGFTLFFPLFACLSLSLSVSVTSQVSRMYRFVASLCSACHFGFPTCPVSLFPSVLLALLPFVGITLSESACHFKFPTCPASLFPSVLLALSL